MFPGKKVIFNKNLYHGFQAFGHQAGHPYPYLHPQTVGVFAVSEHNLQHLQFAFPETPVYRMYASIDTDLFAYRPLIEKRRKIACIAKAPEPSLTLYHLLQARAMAGHNVLKEYEWVFLRGFSQEQMADVLGDALALVCLSTYEGLPRTVVEGLACGCLVVGYGSGPLQECVPSECRHTTDDFIALAKHLEAITAAFPNGLGQWEALSRAGRCFALQFSVDRQREHLLNAWSEITRHSAAVLP